MAVRVGLRVELELLQEFQRLDAERPARRVAVDVGAEVGLEALVGNRNDEPRRAAVLEFHQDTIDVFPMEMLKRLAADNTVEAGQRLGLDVRQFDLQVPDMGLGILGRQTVEGRHRETGVVQHCGNQAQMGTYLEYAMHTGEILQQMDLEPLVRDSLFRVVAEPFGPTGGGVVRVVHAPIFVCDCGWMEGRRT